MTAAADEPLGQRAESSTERVAEWADSLQRHGRPGLAELLRLLTAERDAALARATAAEAQAGRLREALAEARAHIAEERKSLVECDTIPDANEWRDESTMDDLTKEAVAEIDAIFSRIDAALASATEAPA